jgi:hypothetical protein
MPPSRDSFRRNRVAPVDPSILPPFASEQAASDCLARPQRSIGTISGSPPSPGECRRNYKYMSRGTFWPHSGLPGRAVFGWRLLQDLGSYAKGQMMNSSGTVCLNVWTPCREQSCGLAKDTGSHTGGRSSVTATCAWSGLWYGRLRVPARSAPLAVATGWTSREAVSRPVRRRWRFER